MRPTDTSDDYIVVLKELERKQPVGMGKCENFSDGYSKRETLKINMLHLFSDRVVN